MLITIKWYMKTSLGGRGATSYCTKRGSIRMALNSLLTQHEKLHFSNLNTGITGKILNIKTDQIWFSSDTNIQTGQSFFAMVVRHFRLLIKTNNYCKMLSLIWRIPWKKFLFWSSFTLYWFQSILFYLCYRWEYLYRVRKVENFIL